MRAGDEAADRSHALGEGADVEVHLVHHPEMLAGTATMCAQEAEAVGIVDQDAEAVFLLEGADFVEFAEGAGHSVYAFGDEEDAAAALVSLLAGTGENFLAVGDVVVAVFVLAADMEADAVQQAGMALSVIDDDVVTGRERVDGGHDTLVAEVEEEGVFLLLEVGEDFLQLLVIAGVTRHHAGAHRISETPVGRRLGVCLADLGMVREAEIVI